MCINLFSIDASAATSNWQTPYFAKSTCKVRVWTDATNYSKKLKLLILQLNKMVNVVN